MSTRVILVRHGETAASAERRFAGSTDVELTEAGQAQAQALGRRLRHVRIDALYTSPLRRCRQTAAALTEVTGLRAREVAELAECHFGDWEGLTAREVAQRDGEAFGRWLADDTFPPPGGEAWSEVALRVGRWWDDVTTRYQGRTVLAVTHGGPILTLLRRTLDAPYRALVVFEIDPCSVTVIQSRGPLWRLRVVNDTSHLRDPLRDGPPPEEVPP